MKDEEVPEKPQEEKSARLDLDAAVSDRKGLGAILEKTLRRFRTVVPAAILFGMYGLTAFMFGLSLVVPIFMLNYVSECTIDCSFFCQALAIGTTIGLGFFVFGFTLMFVVAFFNKILPTKIQAWRGGYYSLATVPWYIHNGLAYIMRFTFLPFITPTPFNVLFYKMMGMKVGKGVQINSVHISDPSLIELGDKVTVGGSVTLVGHYGSGGFLVLSPVKIGKGATLGLKAIVMGGVEIGENARLLPNSVVMPKTKIPANEIWGGIPAVLIEKKEPRNK